MKDETSARRSCGFILFVSAFCFLLSAFSSPAQGTLSTILSNGPTAKRINLVVFSEGYTTNQLSQFLVDATNAVNNLFSELPYSEYKSYFNAFAISVASSQSGSDHPEYGPPSFVNTYFNSSYDSYGIPRLITIPPNDFDANAANGQGKVASLLASLMPEYDLTMMVVNDTTYGGSGGATFITSLESNSPEIVRHESGHTIGGLTDEYESGPPIGFTWHEYPNATAVTNQGQIRWNAWISGGTPIPTPEDFSYASTLGLFSGAEYTNANWYRAKFNCKMRTIAYGTTTPFCEICSEQLVKSIYGLIGPIDSFTPVSTNVSVYGTQAIAFTITPMQPVSHSLTVEWRTNNVAMPGATNGSCQLLPKLLGNGTHTLKAVVSDPTTMVRTDPNGRLKGTNTWTVTVSLNELSLVLAQYLSSNRFRFTVTGTAPAGFVIQASTNLVNWTSLSTNTLSAGKYDYTNSNLSNLTRRFYRTISPP